MIEHLNTIDVLNQQIMALLDLMMCANDECVDVNSINVASEMCITMQTELMQEVDNMKKELGIQ